jgi:uncharacterized protein (TIGR02271 family)
MRRNARSGMLDPAEAIRRYARGATHEVAGPAAGGSGGPHVESAQPSGFWAWLFGEETTSTATPAEYQADSDLFDRRAAAGNTVLSVTLTDGSQIHHTLTILDQHNPVEIRESSEEGGEVTGQAAVPGETRSSLSGASASEAAGVSSGREEAIPLAKEELEVGKRQVDRGTTRVRRYVVETPVEREVTLHGERVIVERRTPGAAAGSGGTGQFEERTVEVHETDEVPVVQKTTHVDEEVAIRREGTERTETVRDTVRREEVEVTDKEGRQNPIRE